MSSTFDFESWKSEIQSVPRGVSHEDDLKFYELVDEVQDKVDLPVARVLMGTFGDYDDEGVEETVHGTLDCAPCQIFVVSLLEELPRLAEEVPATAYDLLNGAIRRCASELDAELQDRPSEIRLLVWQIATKILDRHPKLAAHRSWVDRLRS